MLKEPADIGDDYNRLRDGGSGSQVGAPAAAIGAAPQRGARPSQPPRSFPSPLNGWFWPLLLGIIAFVLLHPYDLPLFQALSAWGEQLRGDLRREFFAWQQYGQGAAIAVAALLIALLDPRRRRRLLDLALAVAVAQIVSSGGKMLVGRPRPRPEFMDPHSFPGPWGVYPIMRDGQWTLVHAWDRGAGATADLWSMPSSHTLFACVLSVFLATLYPRARWVFAALAVMVALARVVFGAHWPTDVIVGAAAGYAIGAVVTRRGLGVRLLDAIWIRFIDPGARPAWDRIRQTENLAR